MDRCGLKAGDFKVYLEGLFLDHEREVVVLVWRIRDGKPMGELDNIVSGSVTVERRRTPSRQLEVTVADPDGTLSALPPARSQRHKEYGVTVVDRRFIPALGRWVDCTVFTGVVEDVDPTGKSVRIVAHGLDSIADGDAIRAKVWRRKVPKTTVVKDLLRAAGFDRMRIPNLSEPMPTRLALKGGDKDKKKKKRTKLAPGSSRWVMARKVSRSIDGSWALYIGADGVPDLNKPPKKPCLDLHDFLSDPVEDQKAEFVNYWHLAGKKKGKGKKKTQVKASIALPDKHARSAQTLRYEGARRYESEFIEDSKVGTKKKAQRILRDKRDSALKIPVQVSVDCPPVPNFEEGDLVRVRATTGPIMLRLNTWTLPLDGSPMTLGAVVRRAPKR